MVYEVSDDETLLFDFSKTSKKNKAKLKINQGEWSKGFSIDAAGTTGSVECQGKDKRYSVSILRR